MIKEDSRFTEITEMIRKLELLKSDIYKNYMFVSLNMNAKYFNHRSYGEEMLIEKFSLYIEMTQDKPLAVNNYVINSRDMLNLNLTYGCTLSLYKAL